MQKYSTVCVHAEVALPLLLVNKQCLEEKTFQMPKAISSSLNFKTNEKLNSNSNYLMLLERERHPCVN